MSSVPRTSPGLLPLRVDDPETTHKYLFERGLGRKHPNSKPHRFFFPPGPAIRAGGGSEESDGIESSDVTSRSRAFEERVLRAVLVGIGRDSALPLT